MVFATPRVGGRSLLVRMEECKAKRVPRCSGHQGLFGRRGVPRWGTSRLFGILRPVLQKGTSAFGRPGQVDTLQYAITNGAGPIAHVEPKPPRGLQNF